MADPSRSVTTLLGQTMRSVAFLSRLPVPQRHFANGATMRDDAAAFGFAGALIGCVAAVGLLILSALHLPPLLASLFCVLISVLVIGALHEDGLADVADGFFGGANRDERLAIMKDSRVGTYGVIAIVFSIGLRAAALSAILQAEGAFSTGLVLIAVGACSRATMVWFWASMPNVRPGGVADTVGAPSENAVGMAAISGLAIFAVLSVLSVGFFNAAAALLLALAALQGFSRLTREMIGGQTGDALGACQQIVEIMLLTGLALGISIPN